MNAIDLKLSGDEAWPDLRERMESVIHLGGGNDTSFGLAVLSGGMTSGAPSVCFRFDLPDGRVLVAETSWRLLRTACDAIRARYGSGGE